MIPRTYEPAAIDPALNNLRPWAIVSTITGALIGTCWTEDNAQTWRLESGEKERYQVGRTSKRQMIQQAEECRDELAAILETEEAHDGHAKISELLALEFTAEEKEIQ